MTTLRHSREELTDEALITVLDEALAAYDRVPGPITVCPVEATDARP